MVKKQITKIIFILVLIIISFSMAKYYFEFKKYQKQIKNINIQDISRLKMKDGTYLGSYETVWVEAVVRVVIKNKKIETIELVKHKNERGKSAEIILNSVLEEQSLKVDTVTGATVSSKVILKAIENALTNSPK